MLQINLLPVREARRKEDARQLLTQVVLVMILVGAGIGFAHSQITEQIELSKSRINQMQRDIDQFKPQLEQVAAFRKQKAQLEKKIDVIDELDRARSGPVRVLSELASRTPDRLWLTKMKTQGRSIFMEGESLDNDLVALFMRSLGESGFFTEVDLDNTKMGGVRAGLKLVNFKIRAVMSNAAPKKA
jgi:type IV pilus assembly protein PilN